MAKKRGERKRRGNWQQINCVECNELYRIYPGALFNFSIFRQQPVLAFFFDRREFDFPTMHKNEQSKNRENYFSILVLLYKWRVRVSWNFTSKRYWCFKIESAKRSKQNIKHNKYRMKLYTWQTTHFIRCFEDTNSTHGEHVWMRKRFNVAVTITQRKIVDVIAVLCLPTLWKHKMLCV